MNLKSVRDYQLHLYLYLLIILGTSLPVLPSAHAGTLSVTNGSFTNLASNSVTGGGWYGGTPAGWTTGSSLSSYSVLNSGGTYYANLDGLGNAWPPLEQTVGTVNVTSNLQMTFTLTTLAGGLDGAVGGLLDALQKEVDPCLPVAVGADAIQQLVIPRTVLFEIQAEIEQRLALMERLKVMPFGEAWEECCRRAGVPGEAQWIKEAESYEKKVLAKRG